MSDIRKLAERSLTTESCAHPNQQTLAREVIRLGDENARLRGALEFYADKEKYWFAASGEFSMNDDCILDDEGSTARAVLSPKAETPPNAEAPGDEGT